jgi:MFS family permease
VPRCAAAKPSRPAVIRPPAAGPGSRLRYLHGAFRPAGDKEPGRDADISGRPLKKFARIPLRYYLSIPGTIRILAAGILINKVGGFVTIFLTLILSLRHIPAPKIAVALALSAVFAIIGSWLGGALISRLGGRWTIFLAMMGSAVFTAALVFPGPYPLVVTIVCLIALCNRAYVPATATMVGQLSRPDQRVQMYAFYQFSFNIGAAIGPAIAGYLLTRSLTALLLIDAATSACFAVAGLRLPGEARRPPAEPSADAGERDGAGAKPARVRDDRRYLIFCVGVALVAMAYGQYAGPLPLAFRAHHYNLELLGYLFSGNAIAIIVFQLPLSFVTRKLPVWVSLAAGALLTCGAYALLLAGTSLALLIVNFALWTAGEMLFNPVTSTVAMMMSGPRTHGTYQGALSIARSAGQVIGPSAGVFAFSLAPWSPWAACGVLGIAAAALFFGFLRPVGAPPHREKPAAAEEKPAAGE